MRPAPAELVPTGERAGIDGSALANASRVVAEVDSAAVQDGFDRYLHGFIVSDEGERVVVHQGMNGERKRARRYHWLSEGLKSFVDEPHAAIEGPGQGEIVNLTDRRAEASRLSQLEVLGSLGSDGITRELLALQARDETTAASARRCCRTLARGTWMIRSMTPVSTASAVSFGRRRTMAIDGVRGRFVGRLASARQVPAKDLGEGNEERNMAEHSPRDAGRDEQAART